LAARRPPPSKWGRADNDHPLRPVREATFPDLNSAAQEAPSPRPAPPRAAINIGPRLLPFHADAADQAHVASTPDTAWPISGHPPGSSRDRLKAGKFEEAGRAYEEILNADPANLNAARQRGYVGLLSNKFPDAEKYLNMALKLAPDDMNTNKLLGDYYMRQD
jgi:tetratricopeptide (TPR) repeat protein